MSVINSTTIRESEMNKIAKLKYTYVYVYVK